MKATPAQKMKTGVFTIICLGLLIGGIFLIGKRQNLFGHNFHLHCVFRNVTGLQAGNNVRFVGVNVGTVEHINIISDTEAQVVMVLEEKVHPFIKNTSVASIGSDGLMGDKLIVIATGGQAGEKVKDGAKLASVEPTDLTKVLNKIEDVADNASIITGELAEIVTDINQGQGSIGRLIHSDKIARDIEGSVESIRTGTKGFSENMEALKHNFLLKGYYKKKEKERRKEEKKRTQGRTSGRAVTQPR